MKVHSINNYSISSCKEKKISKTSNFTFKRNLLLSSSSAKAIKSGLIAASFLLPSLTSCSLSSDSSDATQEVPTEQVEITHGRLVNRSAAEIKKITGLNPIQFEIAKQLMLDEMNYAFSERYGKIYFKDTDYSFDFFSYSLYFNFTNGEKEFSTQGRSGDNCYSISWPNFFAGYDIQHPKLKVIPESNGDFSIMLRGWHDDNKAKIRIYNFTKDGKLKETDYLPQYMSNFEQQIEKQEKEKEEQASQAAIKAEFQNIENIDLFKNKNKKTIAKFINALGLKNVEYINKKGSNVFFFDGDNCSYKLNLSQMQDDDETYIGIVNKATSDGKSEIYVIKAEMFSTNKSDKFILSKMKVVQDGLDDNAPTYKKHIKETTKAGQNKTTSEHNINLNTRQRYAIVQLFTNFGDWRKFYEGSIDSSTINDLNEIVTESNADGKTIKIISINKDTGEITVQGE